MITHLHVQNFKCLRDVEVDLGPFTILIGPNDSGKSSLLDAIQLLGKTAFQPLHQAYQGDFRALFWRKETNKPITWHAKGTSPEGEFDYSLEMSANQVVSSERLVVNGTTHLRTEGSSAVMPQTGQFGLFQGQTALQMARGYAPLFSAIAASLSSTEKYSLDSDALRSPTPPRPNPSLTTSGNNLAAVLDAMVTGPDRAVVGELERILHEAIPTVAGLALQTLPNSQKSLEFVLSGNGLPLVTIPAAQASDGALLLTAFLALVYGNTPEILLIEEPENGLHPSRLKLVVDLLRKISTGEVGNRKRQVVLATHSPILLNYARPEEVRIFQRDVEGGTRVTPMKEVENIDKLLEEFAIGELWYLLGEKALLKEQPA